MSLYMRSELGDFNSIICFKAAIVGMEDMLGPQATAIALTGAGRKRGANLAESLGLKRGSASLGTLGDVAVKLNDALGTEGTRLCMVDSIDVQDDKVIVRTRETVCSAYEEQGSPRKCTFTLGAIHGALEYLLDKPFFGKHTGSVLRGDTHDVFEFTPR
ncbi:MAG: 4-vinyl reductase [Myxococcales bacterium]|nr:4-vinyl reductase [Myxococcales bacterium]MCB9549502.1 hydrocarbon-binding protein [Myxococcales bacterium]